MEVFSNGKNIPTYSFGNLFIQGEKFADTLIISLERFYNNSDISNYKFMIVGLTEDDYEINQVIMPESIGEKFVKLKWNVSGDFTVQAGKLRLELRAFEDTENGINTIIKYDMPPVNVKPTINGINESVPDTNEQFINSITVVTADCLEQLQNSINNFNVWVQSKIDSFNLDETNNRLDNIEADTAVYLARPEVIPVTRSEYNSMAHKKNALYVIIGEE